MILAPEEIIYVTLIPVIPQNQKEERDRRELETEGDRERSEWKKEVMVRRTRKMKHMNAKEVCRQ